MGSKYNGSSKYSTKYADFVTQSYHPVKAVTTGEGGSIFCKNKNISDKIKQIRNHFMLNTKKDGPWYYEIHEAGFNFRITDFQCALGISQLKKLDKFIKIRRQIAKKYLDNLKDDPRFILPIEKNNCFHSYHIFPLQINFDKIKYNKVELFNKFKKKELSCKCIIYQSTYNHFTEKNLILR